MDSMQYLDLMFAGFGNNLLITLLSIVFPLGLGILFTFLCGKNRTLEKVFHWVSLPFECICPIALMAVMYFMVFPFMNSGLFPIVLTFSLAFLGYMPARYNRSMSAGRNIAYNGLGLASAIYKWSFCVYIIGYRDLFAAANIVRSRIYIGTVMLIPLAVSFVVIAIIEVARRIIKNGAK